MPLRHVGQKMGIRVCAALALGTAERPTDRAARDRRGRGGAMQFGMFDEVNAVEGRTPAQVYDDHLRQVVLSEQLGFHSYWFAEHHFGAHRMAPHPNLLIAAAARETTHLLLGNMV